MRKCKTIDNVVKNGLCTSCGACAGLYPDEIAGMKYDSNLNVMIPVVDKSISQHKNENNAIHVCPGPGYPIDGMSKTIFPNAANSSFELGMYEKIFVAHSSSAEVLEHSSSGGMMTEIALYFLANKIVDGVLCTKFIYGPPGPRVHSYIASSTREIMDACGSKYCPTDVCKLFGECKKLNKRYLLIGPPCHIAALRLAQKVDPALVEIIPYSMSNFCGGYRDYSCLDYLIRKHGHQPENVTSFQFRGNGQPGFLHSAQPQREDVWEKYPDYMKGCPVVKYKRCVYCVDATGELADISCGDSWLERLLATKEPWSTVIIRNKKLLPVIDSLIEDRKISVGDITADEVIFSQKCNITSKKYRQKKRSQIANLLGIVTPKWDCTLPNTGSYFSELKVYLGKFLTKIKTVLDLKKNI